MTLIPHLPITNYQLPITNYITQIPNYKLYFNSLTNIPLSQMIFNILKELSQKPNITSKRGKQEET